MARIDFYDMFVEQHFENEDKDLLQQQSWNEMDGEDQAAYKKLADCGEFTLNDIDFSKQVFRLDILGAEVKNSVPYSAFHDKGTWKVDIFGFEAKVKLLRESSPLAHNANSYEFSHQSNL
ncbi:hypothetical protein BGZ99_009723 [Dissophora globulifera]|uniref:Uncharacterized protein n=1 Tax=Dissophora globulifera TaxID=979702 RepID=A0A9P6UN72_9FUNG|nr:hypothetical protein BGZ99_009723 [Dissophora globulifera]